MTFGDRGFSSEDRFFLRETTKLRDKSDTRQPDGSPPRAAAAQNASGKMHVTADSQKGIYAAAEKWSRFCALALKIDLTNSGNVPQALDRTIMQLLRAAEDSHGAVSQRDENKLYFCALPESDPSAAGLFAEQLQADLAKQRPETISIGMAPYPLLDYPKAHSWTNACKALDHAAFLGPGSTVELDSITLNISGDRHYQDGKIQKAVSEYGAALELDPNNTNARNSLGVCFAEIHDHAAAAEAFEIVAQIDPAEPMAKYNLGLLKLLDDQVHPALAFFKEAFAITSDRYEIPFQIGRLLAKQNRWADALHYVEMAIERCRDHWALHNLKGQCLAALQKDTEAISAYTRAVKLNPYCAEALSALGCLYDAQNENHDICEIFLQKSVALEPDNGLFHHRLGNWHEKKRQWEQALSAYNQAQALGYDASARITAVQAEMQKDDSKVSRRAG